MHQGREIGLMCGVKVKASRQDEVTGRCLQKTNRIPRYTCSTLEGTSMNKKASAGNLDKNTGVGFRRKRFDAGDDGQGMGR
ncbi:hypothetical protein PoB_001384700 [Plakobranchus ocellatus]|uniref:Uncharacterized protein n=1 Tax=Plakobranchus ocellatus TaxID=259542 RepID=A0AAV3YYD6_9GAST|nr:hypothetical protein PoB_001384700 [Plakobranchus ocellatus]